MADFFNFILMHWHSLALIVIVTVAIIWVFRKWYKLKV